MNNENNKEAMQNTSKKTTKKTVKSKNIEITKFDDLEGKFLHVKVGSSEFPASEEHINNIQNQIVDLLEKNNVNCLVFVTHHAVSMDIIERQINN
jgi:hypothetical protein